jgi:HlyD family secretion protein
MRKKVWIAIVVIFLFLLTTGVSIYRQVFAKAPIVQTETVKVEDISSMLLIPGQLQLEDEQKVYITAEKGELKEVLVQEGQQVKKGDVLARLENDQLSLEVEQNKLATESGYLKVNQIKKQEEQLDNKKKDLRKSTSEKEASEQLEAEYDQLKLDKKMAELDLRQTLLQKETLEKRLQELEISSLIDGTVLSVQKQSDLNATSTGQVPMIQVGNLDGMIATGTLSEYDTLKVAVGQKVVLSSDAVPDEKWEGEILKIGTLPNERTSVNTGENQAVQYPVTIKVKSSHIPLNPGFQLIMEIETNKMKAPVVPIDALQGEGDESSIYMIEGNKAKKIDVEVGITSGEKIEIKKGLKEKDLVIVDPNNEIKDGLEVRMK